MRFRPVTVISVGAGLIACSTAAADTAIAASEPSGSSPMTNAQRCDPVRNDEVTIDYGNVFKGVGPLWRDCNGTSSSAMSTTTISASGTVGTTITGTVEASGGVNRA